MNEPEHVTAARALVDEATHATEHLARPDWCLDGAVPATQMTTERGTLRIARESCRYCLADQAAALGLSAALDAYLNTPAPPPPPPPTPEQLKAQRRAQAEHEASMYDAYISLGAPGAAAAEALADGYADWDGEPWRDPDEVAAMRAEATERELNDDHDPGGHDG